MYKILDNLEKLFGWSFLCTLFSRTNLKAYPGLREIHKNLETGNFFSHFPFVVKFYLNFFLFFAYSLTISYAGSNAISEVQQMAIDVHLPDGYALFKQGL